MEDIANNPELNKKLEIIIADLLELPPEREAKSAKIAADLVRNKSKANDKGFKI